MMNTLKITLIAGLLATGLSAQEQAKGYVFEDLNGNGKKDRNEKGIAGVSVTNGEDVITTDAKGKYELSVKDGQALAVIKPAGYTLPVDENNLPQFYYSYRPEGSPTSDFKGIAPTGKLPKSVNFALLPAQEQDSFTALIFGDPQPYTQEEVDFFAQGVVAEVAGIQDVVFGLSLGDLVGNNLDLFNPYIDAIKSVGIPWFNLMGNHDMNFDAASDQLSDETYEAHFGPANYAFNYGAVHVIVLDDILYPDPRDGKGYWGGFREDQLQFVENDLKLVPNDKLIVLAFHIPLSEPEGDPFRDADRERLFKALAPFENTLSLSAHTHIQRQDYFTKEDGWLREKPHHEYNVGTTSGDWYSGKLNAEGIPVSTMRDGTPKGYAFIHFDGNQYSVDYKVAGKPEDFQVELFAPKVVAQGRNTKAGIYANFFMGSAADTVEYRVDNGEWKPMQYVEEQDPSYELSVYEWDTTETLMEGRRSSNPINSTHLWRGNIPAKLKKGSHRVEIRATDQYGKIHTGATTYRLE
ncbi:calcineurin-like phosphoesterase C-terminal domain-containing protein [Leeuwenhoekiella polynyae]|nr:calcineurin-like phosphoesterase C-terminal domain-containing protein [Leeuwenhoekiella polynyae]